MANSEEDYKGLVEQYGVYDYEPYATLYQEENVIFSPVRTDFQREDFAQVFCPALLEMTEHEGPYLIHCDEGINRTGFACVLLLALAGASQEEIVDDYMVTYDNYYGIREAQEPERYAAIREYVYEMFTILTGEEGEAPLSVEKLREGARNYLLFGGLTQEEISRLEEAITK